MAQQLSFSFMNPDTNEGVGIYEIYKLDSAVYPHNRRYHSHIRYLLAESKEAVEDLLPNYITPTKGIFYDVRAVNREHVVDHSRQLKNQLDTCYRVLKFSQ
tara:strand:+ start:45591 stop:45893 length:303 start_codon:yes stop_codon:yes gene_type:complete